MADTSHSEIKANRVRAFVAIQHCSTRKIDMQIYAQILVISLIRPAALAMAQRMDGIHPSTPPSHLLSTQFLSLRFLFLSPSLDPHSSSLFCLRCSFQQREHVLSLSACSRCAAELRQGVDGGRWVRGYKTGLARVWRIVFVGHLRRRGFIEVKKVARHRPPAAMKWAPSRKPSRFFPPAPPPSSNRFRGCLRVGFFHATRWRKRSECSHATTNYYRVVYYHTSYMWSS